MSYHYTMCGLDYVYLKNGYTLHDTPYKEGVSIERADNLVRTIAIFVLISHVRLRGQEVRFLRSLTHDSQADIAMELGVQRITVARWESNRNTPIPGPADRALRAYAAYDIFGPDALQTIVERFSEITDKRPEPVEMVFATHADEDQESLFPVSEDDDEGWKPTKAA